MRKLGALIFPGFELLDLFGPLEMFGMLKDEFSLELVAEKTGAVESNQRVAAYSDTTIHDKPDFDILLIPGGAGTRTEVNNKPLLEWISKTSEKAEYTLSVCTGSALLAKAGVLDRRRATTNKAAFSWVVEQGPTVEWIREARWVEDINIITSSGVSAGMDMTLGAIAIMHGTDTAEQIANVCEYTWQRNKDIDPFAKLHGLI